MHRKYNIEIEDTRKFLKQIKENKPFITIKGSDIWEFGFDTKPFVEYEIPINFPNCCNFHQSVKNEVDKWFNIFPNCCEEHRKLTKKKWFNKDNYKHIPDKILRQLSYTENFISKTIEKDNWYKEITDYIYYNLESFGTPNIGGEQYYLFIQYWIKEIKPNSFKIEKRKREQ